MRLWPLLIVASMPGISHAQGEELRARSLMDAGQVRDAMDLLKAEIGRQPDSKTLHWLLARAYLLERNNSWALRTLATIADIDPQDCEPLLWSAFIQIEQGALDEARASLLSADCHTGTPSETRKQILLAMVDQHAGQLDEAREHLAAARGADQVYREDAAVLEHLTSRLDPGYLPPFSGKLDLSLGWTSNALPNSPTDPASSGTGESSALGRLDLALRFVGPTGRWVRPSVETDLRSTGYTSEAARDVSQLTLAARPGILVGENAPSALLAYRFESLLLSGRDRYQGGPLWFYNAHRAELDARLPWGLSLFGGAGQRLFRERGRSRTELDGGAGGGISISPKARLLAALTARWHGAENRAYDLRGGTALASLDLRLASSWTARAGALLGLDRYPHSAGYFDAAKPSTNRRDVLLKLSVSGYSSLSSRLRAGLTYEFTERLSTTGPYDYRDHQILLRLSYVFSFDPLAPSTVSPEGHVALEHTGASSVFGEDLKDLLRQNEAAQRSSSCVE